MKLNKLVLLSAALMAPMASANVLGFGGGFEFNFLKPSHELNSNDADGGKNAATGVTLHFEHPLPLVPNLRYDGLTSDAGNTFKFNQHHVTGYYRFLDIEHLSLNGGVGVTNISGTKWFSESGELDKTAPHAYVATEVKLPFTGFSIYGDVLLARGSNYNANDNRIGVRYTFDVTGVEPSFSFGYRHNTQEYKKITESRDELSTTGMYASLKIAF